MNLIKCRATKINDNEGAVQTKFNETKIPTKTTGKQTNVTKWWWLWKQTKRNGKEELFSKKYKFWG